MLTLSDLLTISDRFRELHGIERETTLSHRMFGDSKKLTQLRGNADLTVSRFRDSLDYLVAHWPPGERLHPLLDHYVTSKVALVQCKTATEAAE
ncbi:MAG: hypothetical protein LCH92_01410 [Proteobacteria bacterium]|nr:hypothetical protein [Pseudomonadota bacterium]